MRYTDISQLPAHVRALLSDSRQEQWRDAFNTAFALAQEDEQAASMAWKFVFRDAVGDKVEVPNFKLGENYSFIATTEGMTFETDNEGHIESWVQMLPLGKYSHAVYGEINVTPERIARFAANVNSNVRGTQLDIDYEHKENPAMGGRAAGWIQSAEARPDGLWAKIRWTPDGAKAIKNGEYKYISPEFADSWKHPKDGVEHKDVLFGGGITNRPFLKDILPLNLSEVVPGLRANKEKDPHEGREMALLEALRKQFNLSDDATEEQVIEAVTAAQTNLTTSNETLNALREKLELDEKGDIVNTVKSLQEFKLEKTKDEEHAKKFAEMFPEEAKRLAKLAEDNKKAEVTKKLADWTTNSKSKIGIPTKLQDDVEKFRMSLDGEVASGFDALMDRIVEVGTVKLGERGESSAPDGEEMLNTEAEQFIAKVHEEIEAAAKDNKTLQFGEAVRVAAGKHPKLAESYQAHQPTITSAGGE